MSLCLCGLRSVAAQEPALWPGAKYDPAIPTIKQVLGHDHGEVITPPEGIAQYLQALQKAAPTRTRLIEYATTWEGRPLWLFVIGSADRIAKLDQVKADLQRFADPRSVAGGRRRSPGARSCRSWCGWSTACTATRSRRPTRRWPRRITCWPSQGDAGVDAVMRDALVLIDPMQNPDGRARFVFQNLQGRAAVARCGAV